MMKRLQRHEYPDISTLSHRFADYAEAVLATALRKLEMVSLVVPGGNTPQFYLPALAKKSLPWNRITITLSDERWVDTTSEASNEHLVRTHLLNHLPEKAHFIGLKTRHDAPDAGLAEIDQRLKTIPQPFTLTVLGLGEDGHVASLFPGLKYHEILPSTSEHQCIAVDPPIAPSLRISLSLEAIAQSEHIALVVAGKTKRQLLDKLIHRALPLSFGVALQHLKRVQPFPAYFALLHNTTVALYLAISY